MSRKIILVRHAQGLHNVTNDISIHDPELTLLGEEQSVRLAERNPGIDFTSVGYIYTSPLKRAIHTTLLAFINVADKSFYLEREGNKSDGAEVILEPLLQEIGDEPANSGSDVAVLKKLWPNLNFNPLRNPSWPHKTDLFSPTSARSRAMAFLKVLETQSNQLSVGGKKDIVVVSHGGFIQALTDPTTDFELVEARTYEISTINGHLKLEPFHT